MNTFTEAFEGLVKDMYSAEKMVLKALPKVAKTAKNPELRQSIQLHMRQTEGQIKRIEEVAQKCGFKPGGKVCVAAQGLIEEMDEHLKEGEPGAVMDAVIVALAQKFEHYEIASYGTIVEWGKVADIPSSCVSMMAESLHEEEETDQLLTQLAEGHLNQSALEATGAESKGQSGKGTAKYMAAKKKVA